MECFHIRKIHRDFTNNFVVGTLLVCSVIVGQDSLLFAQDVKKVLLVHSVEAGSPWGQAITKGVREAFGDRKLILDITYMNSCQNPLSDEKVSVAQSIQEKIAEFKPDVIIAADDTAQIFVTQKYLGLRHPPFVFCGVNGDLESYRLPADNTTGILERPHFARNIMFLKSLGFRIKKVAVLSDSSPDSMGAYNFLTHEDTVGVKVLGYHIIKDFSTWKARVEYYNLYADAIFVYLYHTIRADGDQDARMPPGDIMDWTLTHADIPIVGFFDFGVQDGMLCGVGESGYEHGFEAGTMALKMLQGAQVKDLPIKKAGALYKMINLRTAEKFGISLDESQLSTIDWVMK